jgi:hypothetical protein
MNSQRQVSRRYEKLRKLWLDLFLLGLILVVFDIIFLSFMKLSESRSLIMNFFVFFSVIYFVVSGLLFGYYDKKNDIAQTKLRKYDDR